MKKTALRFVATASVVAALGVGAAWYALAGKAVTQAEQVIAALNAKTLPDNGTVKLTYDALHRVGFPAFGVRLVNPVLSVNMPRDAAGNPPVDVVWKREGTLDVITDYFSHEYRVVSNGKGNLKLQSGEDALELISDAAPMEASVKARDRKAFDAWGVLNWSNKEAVRAALRDIAALHFSAGAYTMKDSASSAVLISQEHSRFDVTNRSSTGVLNFEASADIKAFEMTKEYSAVMAKMLKIMQLPQALNDDSVPLAATRAGKQDVSFKVSANMPESPSGKEIPNGFIHVPSFTISNDFYHLELPFDVVLKEVNDQRTATVRIGAMLNVTPAGAGEMQYAMGFIPAIQPVLAKIADAKPDTNVDPEQIKQKLTEALPTVSTLGPVKFTVDLEAAVPTPREGGLAAQAKPGEMRSQNLTIRAFSFDHARWGIDLKGMAARAGKVGNTVDMTLLCKHCETMTKDIYESVQAVQSLLNLFNPAREQWAVNDAFLTRLNNTLADIGRKDDATGNITFSIGSSTSDAVRINDKPMAEVMPKLMALFDPEVAQEQEAISNNGEITK